MEPAFTTNSTKNQDDDHEQLQKDHQPLIDSEEAVFQETKKSSNSLIENASDEGLKEEREKVMIHGKEMMSSRVVIPERWGQEGFLKDWIDGSTFDALLAPKGAALAREALIAQPPPPHTHFKLRF